MRWNRLLARRWTCLILGGALLMPYMMAGVLVVGWVRREAATPLLLLPVELGVFAAVLPIVALTGLFLPVRALEVNAAQSLLGAAVTAVPHEGRRSWQERRRTSAWYTLHLAVGGVVSGCTLAIVPFTAVTAALPFTGASDLFGGRVEPGWSAIGWPAAGLAMLVVLVALAAGSGALLARLAPVLLGPTPAERLAAAEARARDLARRNRLARELHDSVGHALSVVTIQAAAAGRVLDRDPGTARTALEAIERSARAALEDLDHALGVLRADGGERAGGATLAELDTLARSTGAEVRRDVGDLSAVPAPVSREAYRIVQEALTNAVKHGRGPIHLSAHVRDGALDLLITNRTGAGDDRGDGPDESTDRAGRAGRDGRRGPAGEARAGGGAGPGGTREREGGGRGLGGMRERAGLLGGEVVAGPGAGGWRVAARLPLRSEP
ncbi:sensor histidine kinase [Nonomuraea sp. CA-218870]|uniref:sensor histidine kinase n=1 Tax=Nonomuraea sp. CA-218870 TaxID=3239998 RepID=UPI003D8A0894